MQTEASAYGEQVGNYINSAFRIPLTFNQRVSLAQHANNSSHHVTQQLDELDRQLAALRT